MNPGSRSSRVPVLIAVIATLLAVLSLAIPMYVIRPFVPQSPGALAFALHVRNIAPVLAHLCLLFAALALFFSWRAARLLVRTTLAACTVLTALCAIGSSINIFEQMFHPYPAPVFVPASQASIAPSDKLLTLAIAGRTHAFPIRTMGYHHIVNDTLGGVPIAATYCTLCHTGIVYDRRLDGRTLYFTLAGINNGNALLRDRETGSIWQQSTGEAIFGPLKGRRLTLIPSDELSFALWQKEQPQGLILAPDAAYAALYDPADWEAHIARTHVVVDTSATGIEPHTIMLGIANSGGSKAFPIDSLLADHLIEDHAFGQPLLLVVGPDNTSVRVFDPRAAGQTLRFMMTSPGVMIDRETGSSWNFNGCATSGPMTGQCLPQLEAHKDYWFDWHNHHPDTMVFRG